MNVSNNDSLDHNAISCLKDATEEMFEEIINVYLDDTPKRLALLSSAISNNDFNTLIEESHSIKGSSGNIGALKLSSLCALIEQASRDQQITDLSENINLAIKEFDAVKEALNYYTHA